MPIPTGKGMLPGRLRALTVTRQKAISLATWIGFYKLLLPQEKETVTVTKPHLNTPSVGTRLDSAWHFIRANATGRAITMVAMMYIGFGFGTLLLCRGGLSRSVDGAMVYVVGGTITGLVAKRLHLNKREFFAALLPATAICLAAFAVYAMVALGWYALIGLVFIIAMGFMATDPLAREIVHGQPPMPPTPDQARPSSGATSHMPPDSYPGYTSQR